MSTDAELRRTIEFILSERVTELERRPSESRSSFELDELDVRLAGGRRLELMLKYVGRLEPAVRAVKPAFLYDPLREIELYRDVLEPAGLGTPRFFGADCERGWLFIERVQGVELFQVGERATWEFVARWLAGMHGQLAGDTARAPRAVRYDRPYLERWPRRALAFARERGDKPAANAIAQIANAYGPVLERLLALSRTVVHGEFYASNVLVDASPDPRRVAPVDWEQAGVGPGLVDLAALTAGRWSDADRAAIASAYAKAAGGDLTADDLEACRLHVALQWLGWSSEWSPPREHRHDWLAEAWRSAETLGL